MYKFHFETEELLVLSFFKNVLIWKYMLIAFIKNLRKILKFRERITRERYFTSYGIVSIKSNSISTHA